MLDRAHLTSVSRTPGTPRTSRTSRTPFGTVALGLALTFAVAASACTKSEGHTDPSADASTSATATAAVTPPSAEAKAASPEAGPTATDPTGTADATAPKASAGTAATAATATAASAGAGDAASAAPACGKKPLPDCPLQGWMKLNTNPAVSANDLPALATALDKIVTFAPAGYTNWASIAKDGAKAARAGDMTAAKASCRTCHDQYKDKYKKEMRARKI